MNLEKHFVTWLNLQYLHVLSISFTRNLFSGFLRLLERALPCPTTFCAVLGKYFHYIRLKYSYNSVNNRKKSVHSEIDER